MSNGKCRVYLEASWSPWLFELPLDRNKPVTVDQSEKLGFNYQLPLIVFNTVKLGKIKESGRELTLTIYLSQVVIKY